jgi:hypothetical protein
MNNGNDNCAGTICAKESTLRNRIGDIMVLLETTSKHLVEAEQKLYMPKVQSDCNAENGPCDDSLEYVITKLGQFAQKVRNQAVEVNSRI